MRSDTKSGEVTSTPRGLVAPDCFEHCGCAPVRSPAWKRAKAKNRSSHGDRRRAREPRDTPEAPFSVLPQERQAPVKVV